MKPDERGSFSFGAVFAVKMVSALLDAGLPETTVERAADEGWLDFRYIDDYLPHEPGAALRPELRGVPGGRWSESGANAGPVYGDRCQASTSSV